MRVVNDREERRKDPEIGVLSLLSHSLYTAAGISTLLLGPLAMLFGALRMVSPWPQVSALFGAVLALTLFDVPVVLVLFSFVMGMVVMEGVIQQRPVFTLLGLVALVSVVLGAGIAWSGAHTEGLSLVTYWEKMVTEFLSGVREQTSSGALVSAIQWDNVEALLVSEGPFLFLSLIILSVWFSVGVAAHFGWWPKESLYSAEGLRGLIVSPLFGYGLLLCLFVSFFPSSSFLWSGIARLLSSLLFIQGTVVLSKYLQRRGFSRSGRTLFYFFSVVFGFYALVGLGIFSPWLRRHEGRGLSKRGQDPLQPKIIEEVV